MCKAGHKIIADKSIKLKKKSFTVLFLTSL